MRNLNNKELNVISGAGDENVANASDSCRLSTLIFLESCDMDQLHEINKILKDVVSSDEWKDADKADVKAAMIDAIQNSKV